MNTTSTQRERLKDFLDEMLVMLGRAERRQWGSVYVRGLLATGGHKATASMAAQVSDGNVQAMQQFIGQSPWSWDPLRKEMAHRMTEALHPVAAWVVDDTGFPKKGSHSVGVARQYSGTLGKIGNCQVAVSLHYATDDAAVPLDFTLYLPEEWLEEKHRREAGIPQEVTFQTKWSLALALIDRALAWEVPRGVISADVGYGNITDFRLGLAARKLLFVVGIQNTTTVWLNPDNLVVPFLLNRSHHKSLKDIAPLSVAEVYQHWAKERWQYVTWREGSKGPMTSRFAAERVLPSHSCQYDDAKPKEETGWLLVEWPGKEATPTKFWFANLPENTTLLSLVRLAKIRWWIEQGYQQLKDELGLDHYEGRSWQGWHHHVTMTMLAFGFLTLETLSIKKNFWTELVSTENAP